MDLGCLIRILMVPRYVNQLCVRLCRIGRFGFVAVDDAFECALNAVSRRKLRTS